MRQYILRTAKRHARITIQILLLEIQKIQHPNSEAIATQLKETKESLERLKGNVLSYISNNLPSKPQQIFEWRLFDLLCMNYLQEYYPYNREN